MEIQHRIVVLDAADIEAESSFWAAVLDGDVRRSEDWHDVEVDGTLPLAVQHAPDHIRPEWPDRQPQQLHLDLYVPDIHAAHARVMELGATLLQSAEAPAAGSGFQVYADPAGHPFCLCWR